VFLYDANKSQKLRDRGSRTRKIAKAEKRCRSNAFVTANG
jgi:hypothetical protein